MTTRPPDPVTGPPVRRALAMAARVGPYFHLGQAASAPVTRLRNNHWVPAIALADGGEFARRAAAQFPQAEPRVAASVIHLGYAARLWSPVLGAGLLAGLVPDLATLEVDPDWAVRLAPGEPRGWPATDPAQLAALCYQVVVTAHLEPLAAALAGTVAPGLLWGNAASALIGALSVLTADRPAQRAPAAAVATALLAQGRLNNTGDLHATPARLSFRRRSCCLYYRLPASGLCGDCALSRIPGARP
jgi:hypothetical protein